MNRLLVTIPAFLIFVIIQFSCNEPTPPSTNKTNEPYHIIGQVKNIPSGMIYLNMMHIDSAGHPNWPVIDSAKYENGKFEMMGDTLLTEPAWSTNLFYIDSITGNKKFIGFTNTFESKSGKPSINIGLTLENTDITIEGDEKDGTGLTLTGCPETSFFFQYGLMRPPYHLTEPVNEKIDSLESNGDTTGLASLKAEKMAILEKYKTGFKKTIKANPDRFQALVNVFQNAFYFSLDEVEQMLNGFNPTVLQYPTALKIKNYIAKERSLLPGGQFPNFSYTDNNGKKWSLQDVKGKQNTLVVFWASWCFPCRQEIPELKELQKKYAAQGLSLVSISIDHDIEAWKKALIKENMPWPNLANLPGDYKEIMTEFNVSAVPKSFLLDKDLKVILANPRVLKEVDRVLIKPIP